MHWECACHRFMRFTEMRVLWFVALNQNNHLVHGSGKCRRVSFTKLLSLHKYCQSELSESSGPIDKILLSIGYKEYFKLPLNSLSQPLSQRTGKPEVVLFSASLTCVPWHQISVLHLQQRMPSGLPSLAGASSLIFPRGFSSKFQAPHNNLLTRINCAQERGHSPSSLQHQWPLEQPTQKLHL